jgi:hypothetical protein
MIIEINMYNLKYKNNYIFKQRIEKKKYFLYVKT